MKYKKRKFVPNEWVHVYQRAVRGLNIFYDREDRLVFYTIFSVLKKIYNVKVMGLCLMVDHVHVLVTAEDMKDISAFLRHYTSLFVMEFNHSTGRHGPLFHKSFGSAPKAGGKKIRSTLVYIGNNPVEKKLCQAAEEYRWNFLAYLKNDNPYSTAVPLSKSSMKMRRALKIVQGAHNRNEYLSYACIQSLFDDLDKDECERLTDYISIIYHPLDIDALHSYYASYDDMILAMKSSAGGEYDIKEVFHPGTDAIYDEMARYVRDKLNIKPVRKVTALSTEMKIKLSFLLKSQTSASTYQISKFLHLNSHGGKTSDSQ